MTAPRWVAGERIAAAKLNLVADAVDGAAGDAASALVATKPVSYGLLSAIVPSSGIAPAVNEVLGYFPVVPDAVSIQGADWRAQADGSALTLTARIDAGSGTSWITGIGTISFAAALTGTITINGGQAYPTANVPWLRLVLTAVTTWPAGTNLIIRPAARR